MADFRSPWASIYFVATSVAIVFLTSPAAHSATLIRCPDWQRYVTPAAALRSTQPKQSFEAALAANRAKESRVASATPQRMPTRTLAGHRQLATSRTTFPRTAKTESAASRTTGPLDAAGIFGRDGRTTKTQAPSRTPRSARPSQKATTCQYTVRKGDTLAKIATRRLGNSRRWPELAKANSLTSPSRLRIGQILQLPCAPDGQRGHPQAGVGSTPTTPTPVSATRQPVVPQPVWTARPGEFVSDVITRWAKRAGHTVVRDGVEEWKISVPVSIRGKFKHALDQLVVGFEGSGRPLAISLYANKVIRIGRPL